MYVSVTHQIWLNLV